MLNADNGACLVDEILRGIAAVYEWPSYQPQTKSSIPMSQADLERYPGRYGTEKEKNAIYDISVSSKNQDL